jgi:hypothetical protein
MLPIISLLVVMNERCKGPAAVVPSATDPSSAHTLIEWPCLSCSIDVPYETNGATMVGYEPTRRESGCCHESIIIALILSNASVPCCSRSSRTHLRRLLDAYYSLFASSLCRAHVPAYMLTFPPHAPVRAWCHALWADHPSIITDIAASSGTN